MRLLLAIPCLLLTQPLRAQMVSEPDPYAKPDSSQPTFSRLSVTLPLHPDDAMARVAAIIAVEGLKVKSHSDYQVEIDPSGETAFDPGFIRIQVIPIAEARTQVVLTGYTLPYDEVSMGTTPTHHDSEQIRLTPATNRVLRSVNRKTWSGMARLATLIATVSVD